VESECISLEKAGYPKLHVTGNSTRIQYKNRAKKIYYLKTIVEVRVGNERKAWQRRM
jgi:hypothetical protein